ncbi:hypothetical protein [Pseudoxanthomonas sp. SE1]|uniref:hypothetical protein n=1 Tax=Pseudoxanthomonas sp. SE1 TaxID=1664560 RepID=UPI00240E7EDF|nr:hypothetical protein [Pseudoxanthomonas sp. SE1]WFC43533.1 hypothetical protein OY559_08560 [Pseudoxanthomonas sp. SE1]
MQAGPHPHRRKALANGCFHAGFPQAADAGYRVGLWNAHRHATPHSRPQVTLSMAKPNYSFEKRQRELAKKKKKDEKDAKKRAERDAAQPGADPEPGAPDTAKE